MTGGVSLLNRPICSCTGSKFFLRPVRFFWHTAHFRCTVKLNAELIRQYPRTPFTVYFCVGRDAPQGKFD